MTLGLFTFGLCSSGFFFLGNVISPYLKRINILPCSQSHSIKSLVIASQFANWRGNPFF